MLRRTPERLYTRRLGESNLCNVGLAILAIGFYTDGRRHSTLRHCRSLFPIGVSSPDSLRLKMPAT